MSESLIKTNFWDTYLPLLVGRKKIFCGFSGGADSTALLFSLSKDAKKYGFDLKAVHFQHGLRGNESYEDAKWCRQFCEINGIYYLEISIDVRSAMKGNESFEDAARKLRLKEWKVLTENKLGVVALGHNSDDRNENMIIRLLRGANVSGISSLREFQVVDGVVFLRPLLNFTRDEIEGFLEKLSIYNWRLDSTNNDNNNLRNYIRNYTLSELSDLYDGAKKGMARAAIALEQDAAFIETETEKKWENIKTKMPENTKILLKDFSFLHNALKIRILRKWLSSVFEKDYIPGYDLLLRIEDAIAKINTATNKNAIKIPFYDSHDFFFEISTSAIALIKTRSNAKRGRLKKWDWTKEPDMEWNNWKIEAEIISKNNVVGLKMSDNQAIFDAGQIPETIGIREWKEGDRMRPFGFDKNVKLKKIFEGKKIPAERKQSFPVFVLLADDKIIWVGGLRRSDFAPVSPKTTGKILKITVSPRKNQKLQT
jgi:tRNA(Ile)-lysidine synthase